MNLVQSIEKQEIERLTTNKQIPNFEVGNTITVTWKVREDNFLTQRTQEITGTVIKKVNKGVRSSFTIKKDAGRAGWVLYTMPLYSPLLQSVKVIKEAKVRRAKLYYWVGLTGKAARLKAKTPATHNLVNS